VRIKMRHILIILVLFLANINLVFSQAGLVWSSQSAFIEEGETKCNEYGMYNPWDTAAESALYVGGEVAEIADTYSSDVVFLPAQTLHGEAIKRTLCFTAPMDVYKDECLLPGVGCAQSCDGDDISYKGQVSAVSEIDKESGGSSIRTAASAPVEFIVKCVEKPRDMGSVYLMGIILVAIILIVVYFGSRKSSKKGKK
jgi:hypothetical protein